MTPLFDVALALRKIPKWEGRPTGDLDYKYLLLFVVVLSGLVEAYSIGTDYSNSY